MTLQYRPEIDGLRAIAVVAVVLYHAEFIFRDVNLFKGGFIGVDVFFVISGYLISSIILREMNEGRFSFVGFYERRARRILPVLFTVMLVSIPFAWLYMLPKAVKEFSGSVLSALVFGSNLWFLQEDSYWAEPSALKPFLHTWSLSVEEQFYVLFPIILLLLWKFAREYLASIFVLGFLLSLHLADFGSANYAEATFFLLPTRGWELLAGAILAKLEMTNARMSHSFLAVTMPVMGLFLIGGAVVLLDNGMRYPSLITLFPVVGTMILIWFCHKGELVTELLSSKPFVSVGLISYGFYLWHYPVFAFSQIKDDTPTQYDKMVWIILSLFLSAITYFLIEKPARNSSKVLIKHFIAVLVCVLVLISLPLSYAFNHDGLWGRFSDWQLKYIGHDRTGTGPFAKYVNAEFGKLKGRKFSTQNGKKHLLLIGDSFAADFTNILNEGGLLDGVDVSTHYIPRVCMNVPSTSQYVSHIDEKYITRCKRVVRIGDERLNAWLTQAHMIIVASSWEEFTTQELPRLYQALRNTSRAQILIVGRKNYYSPKTEDIVSMENEKEWIVLRKSSSNALHYETVRVARKLMSGIQDYVDLHEIVCGIAKDCPVTTPDGYLISYDSRHLSKEGAMYISELLKQNDQFMTKWDLVFGNQ